MAPTGQSPRYPRRYPRPLWVHGLRRRWYFRTRARIVRFYRWWLLAIVLGGLVWEWLVP